MYQANCWIGLVKGPMTQEGLESIFRQLKKAVVERAMGAEMSDHLGYGPRESKPEARLTSAMAAAVRPSSPTTTRCESRYQATAKVASSRIGKHERRFTGFDQNDYCDVRPQHDSARYSRLSL